MGNCYLRTDPNDPNSPRKCTKGFPYPILDESIIVFPLHCNDAEDEKKRRKNQDDPLEKGRWKSNEEKKEYVEKCKANFVKIKTTLDILAYIQTKRLRENEQFPALIEFEQFLLNNKLSRIEYIDALRTSIIKPTVFYKRTSHDIMVNPYNKDILARHKSNMDIQYVINSYALISYITAYMMKSNAKISKLMATAIDEVKTKTNLSHRQKLQAVANCWQNGS